MNKEKTILGEIERRTKKNERHYRKNDGTTECVISNANINYFDEKEQKWKHTDNSLVEKENCYEGNLGNFRAKISKENKGIDVSGKDVSVAWEYLGMEKPKKKGRKPKNTKKPNLNVHVRKADNEDIIVGSDALYEEADDGVDIQYIMQGNNVKENIIVKKKHKEYKFKFAFKLNGLKMKVSEDHTKIELYSEKTDKLEFTIPSPYMYDANNTTSTDVCYEIEETENEGCIFYVVASETWINASERQFPVTVDPQLVTNTTAIFSGMIRKTVYGTNSSTISEYAITEYLKICDTPTHKIETNLVLHKYLIDIEREKIASAYVILTSTVPFKANTIKINGKIIDYSGTKIRFPITDIMKNSDGLSTINIYYTTTGEELLFYATGDNMPKLEINYVSDINKVPTYEKFSLVGDSEAIVDVCNGDVAVVIPDVSDDVIGVNISHVLKPSDIDYCCGTDVKLNIYERFEKNKKSDIEENYIYIDSMGKKHLFNERFWYVDKFGLKQYVDKSEVRVLIDGTFTYCDESTENPQTYFVEREEISYDGLKATTKLEGVEQVNYLEQRVDEIKDLEQRISSYEDTLFEMVLVNNEGEIVSELNKDNILNNFENFISASNAFVMTKNEAKAMKNALCENKNMNYQKLNLRDQIEMIKSVSEQRKVDLKVLFKEYEYSTQYYDKMISDFVVVKPDGEVVSEFKIYDKSIDSFEYGYDEFTNLIAEAKNKRYVLTKNEAAQVRSLALQRSSSEDDSYKECLFDQINCYFALDAQRRFEYNKLCIEKENLNDSYKKKIYNYVLTHSNGIVDWQYEILNAYESEVEKFLNCEDERYAMTRSEAAQFYSLYLQKTSLENSIDLIEKQYIIQNSEIVSNDDAYKKMLVDYYKEYLNLMGQLDKLKLQIPVNYIVSDNYVKGFNETGELVVIYGNHNDYVAIEYSKYYVGTTAKNRITSVYNQDERTIHLFYDETNRLSEIVGAEGKSVVYTYADGKLKTMAYSNGKKYEISFHDGEIDISDATGNSTKIKLSNEVISEIETKTDIVAISHNSIIRGKEQTISNIKFECICGEQMIITDNLYSKTVYVFDTDTENLIEFYNECNGKIIRAEKYSYDAFGHMNVEMANESVLEKNDYDNFVFPIETANVETIQNAETAVNNHKLKLLDEYNKVVKEIDIQVDESKRLVTTNYTYDESDRVVKVEAKTVDEAETTLVVQTMEYDSAGRLVRKQSYEVGKEAENGIDIDEYVYNEKGYEIKSIKYNTLDTSSKLYTEKETNDIGQITSELDVLGKHKSTYEYLAGTNTVCSKLSPNGSKLSYGFSPENGQDSITMSTEDGEENSTQRFYTNGLLTQVISGDNVYEYTYDHKGRETSVSINGQLHISYSYEDRITENGKTVNKAIATYVNGDNVTVTEDLDGNVLSVNKKPYDYDALVVENRTRLLDPNASQIELNITNEYDDTHRVIKKMDSSVNDCVFTNYVYDAQNRVTSYKREATFGDSLPYEEEYSYNAHGNVNQRIVKINSAMRDISTYEYNENTQKLTAINCAGSARIEPKLDCLGRNRGKTVSWNGTKIYSEDITYLKHGDHATSMPLTISYGNNTENGFVVKDRIKYKYDEMGNICEVYENGQFVTEYKYDALGRLVRENNKKLGKTFVFSYDNKGNIVTRTEYVFTLKDDDFVKEATGEMLEYVYSGEKLVSYNGELFEYDDIGNPTTYRGNTLTWRFGRRLTSFGANTFDYNAEGKRIKKNGISYIYDSQGRLFAQSNGIEYFYDENSSPIAFAYNGEVYYYKKDLLANIIEILDKTGTTVVKYTYDAWGNHTVTDYTDFNLGSVNPIRYRSYYYDTEIGLYFLQTRYYDPQIGRFINIDDISYLDPKTINGLNLYSYCGNNPITRIDACGCDWWNPFTWDWSGIFKSIGNAFSIAGQWVNNNVLKPIGTFFESNWDIILGVGLVIGAIVISVVTFGAGTVIAGVIAGAVFGAAFGAINALASGGNVLQGAFTGMFVGALGGVSGWAAFAGAAGMSLINDRINGEKAGMGSLFKAALAGLTAGLFAGSCNGMFNAVKNELASKTIESIASVLFSFVFSAQNFATDIIINALMSK